MASFPLWMGQRSLLSSCGRTAARSSRFGFFSFHVPLAKSRDVISPGLQRFCQLGCIGTRLLIAPAGVSLSEGKDLTACGAESPLPSRGLRGMLGETVKALVDCPVTVIFFTKAAVAFIDIAQERAGPRVTMILSDK